MNARHLLILLLCFEAKFLMSLATAPASKRQRNEYNGKFTQYYEKKGELYLCSICNGEYSRREFYRHVKACVQENNVPPTPSANVLPSNLEMNFETAVEEDVGMEDVGMEDVGMEEERGSEDNASSPPPAWSLSRFLAPAARVFQNLTSSAGWGYVASTGEAPPAARWSSPPASEHSAECEDDKSQCLSDVEGEELEETDGMSDDEELNCGATLEVVVEEEVQEGPEHEEEEASQGRSACSMSPAASTPAMDSNQQPSQQASPDSLGPGWRNPALASYSPLFTRALSSIVAEQSTRDSAQPSPIPISAQPPPALPSGAEKPANPGSADWLLQHRNNPLCPLTDAEAALPPSERPPSMLEVVHAVLHVYLIRSANTSRF